MGEPAQDRWFRKNSACPSSLRLVRLRTQTQRDGAGFLTAQGDSARGTIPPRMGLISTEPSLWGQVVPRLPLLFFWGPDGLGAGGQDSWGPPRLPVLTGAPPPLLVGPAQSLPSSGCCHHPAPFMSPGASSSPETGPCASQTASRDPRPSVCGRRGWPALGKCQGESRRWRRLGPVTRCHSVSLVVPQSAREKGPSGGFPKATTSGQSAVPVQACPERPGWPEAADPSSPW